MFHFEEINLLLVNASFATIVKLIITVVVIIVSLIVWKYLRTLDDRATSKAKEMIQVRTSEEETEDECGDGQELGLVGKLKYAKLRKMEEELSDEQRAKEDEIQKQQLAAIFELLKKQQEELNTETITKDDLNAQLRLYR
ncbi:uncharacterized protein DMENIID0001_137550 [Sergentomyia squamirostris]